MSKKVVFNGIKILTNEDDSSAHGLLRFVDAVIGRLESDLDRADENFNLSISMDFAPNRAANHSFTMTSLSNNGTMKKVMKILEKTTGSRENKIAGTVKLDLQVKDA